MEKTVALIPARYASTRLPGKLMKMLGSRPVIVQTYLATVQTGLFDEVYVVTDSREIAGALEKVNGKVLMSDKEYSCGSDRIAGALPQLPDARIILNVQGDEPFIRKEPLKALLDLFTDPEVQVGSLMHIIEDSEAVHNPNNVKVVADLQNRALMFSRSAIPNAFNPGVTPEYHKHIGVYGFRREALLKFPTLTVGPLEKAERIECLRFLENNIMMKMALTESYSIGIDTAHDLEQARALL